MYEAAGNGTQPRWDLDDLAPDLKTYNLLKNLAPDIKTTSGVEDQLQKMAVEETKRTAALQDLKDEDAKKKALQELNDLETKRKALLELKDQRLGQAKVAGRMRIAPWNEDRGPNPYLLITGQAGNIWGSIRTVAGRWSNRSCS